jgi:hypothetical protein
MQNALLLMGIAFILVLTAMAGLGVGLLMRKKATLRRSCGAAHRDGEDNASGCESCRCAEERAALPTEH